MASRMMKMMLLGGDEKTYGEELLANGGFEVSGGVVWDTWNEVVGSGAISDEETIIHSGSHAAKMTRGAGADCYMQNRPSLVPGALHRLEFWSRGDGTNAGLWTLQEGEAPYTNIVAEQSTGNVTVGYQRIILYFTPVNTSVYLSFAPPPVEGGIAYFDDVSIKIVNPTYGPEVLPFGDFETAGAGGADIWSGWAEYANSGAIADETTLVYSGGHAAKLTRGAAADTYMQYTGTVTAGKMYRLQFRTRGDGTNAGKYGLQIGADPYTAIIAETSTLITGTVYQLVQVVFVAPITSIILSLVAPATEGGVAYFDEVSIQQLNP